MRLTCRKKENTYPKTHRAGSRVVFGPPDWKRRIIAPAIHVSIHLVKKLRHFGPPAGRPLHVFCTVEMQHMRRARGGEPNPGRDPHGSVRSGGELPHLTGRASRPFG